MALMSRANTRRMLVKLEQAYPDAKCALNFSNPFELLIATMLSAQCTDVRVNMVTERLFQKYRGPQDYAAVSPDILQEDIKELGLFRAKAEHIVAASRMILEVYHGEVPQTAEELVKLPGVGRKTANVVLSNAFGIPALAVDTHVQRVSNRIGIAHSMNPEITERQLCQRIPQKLWGQAHHWLIHHGRQVCTARNPKCDICPVSDFCAFYQKLKADQKLRDKVFEEKPAPARSKRAGQRKS
ncbi:endonuclease III [Alicyclobacillus cycloheptanicus]|uniref:Endonuclease III n=1 Tax=Alicyclobacillus cycloheptanicus TaxID=1457 RepID=A0ABT9XKC8_9BACL|nr:endonuclease III [Alicyclobacillus cycloheptanicus]MDQ0190750.1 endonuclease-3 [Alicyclobacillus cycloheptanicus]WDL99863.1 endonuclease III [Alicyclobacillus cycloheptanicus]